jgi:hypothetical protein
VGLGGGGSDEVVSMGTTGDEDKSDVAWPVIDDISYSTL